MLITAVGHQPQAPSSAPSELSFSRTHALRKCKDCVMLYKSAIQRHSLRQGCYTCSAQGGPL